jgi:hypothetical protein
VPDETCDDGNTTTEMCGDGTKQNGTFCNATCSAVVVRSETCDYTGSLHTPPGDCGDTPVGCTGRQNACDNNCTLCAPSCPVS